MTENRFFDPRHPKIRILEKFKNKVSFVPFSGGMSELQISQVLHGRRKLTESQAKMEYKAGATADITATGPLTIKGAMAEISADAVLTLKGGLVRIN